MYATHVRSCCSGETGIISYSTLRNPSLSGIVGLYCSTWEFIDIFMRRRAPDSAG